MPGYGDTKRYFPEYDTGGYTTPGSYSIGSENPEAAGLLMGMAGAAGMAGPSSLLSGLAAGAVIPGPLPPGVRGGTFGANNISKIPWVEGPLADLPINAKGPGSMFLNPNTGHALYSEMDHVHDSLARAASVPPQIRYGDAASKLDPNYSRIRWNGDWGPVHIAPPDRTGLAKTMGPIATSQLKTMERQDQASVFKYLTEHNLIPDNRGYKFINLWNSD